MRRPHVRAPLGLVAAVAALVLGAWPQPAWSRGVTLGFGDPAFNESARDTALDQSVAAGAQVVRLGVNWGAVAPQRPADPSNPADPAYRFANVDAAVRAASARGLQVLLELGRAPGWAEGPNRSADAPPGTWRPNADAYGQFARAVAARYGGGFPAGIGQPALPRVSRYQAWNEPNLTTYLTPQGSDGDPESARTYRDLLSAFYAGVKSVDPGNLVVSAGTAPYGGATQSGSPRTHPVSFLRELLCLNGGSLAAADCQAPVPFDVLAHHPINAGSPFERAENPVDATTPDIGRIRNVLREAERKRRVVPSGSHPIWVTEFWWETDPPDRTYGIPERTQARYTAEALYLFWKQRVPLVLGLQLADSPIDPAAPGASFQTGLYFADGSAKKSLSAFRFPLVAVRKRHATRVWGRAPLDGRLRIEQRRDGRWRRVDRIEVDAGGVFKGRIRGGGRAKIRARLGGEESLRYRPRARS